MIQKNYQKLHNRFKKHAPVFVYKNVFRHRQIVKYVISGATSASVDLLIYYLLTYEAQLWYVASSVFSFIIAFWVSFGLQKFWTFRDKSAGNMAKQTYLYFIAAIANLGISALLIYLFVDHIGFHKFISKIFSSAIVAGESFFVYKFLIFNQGRIQ